MEITTPFNNEIIVVDKFLSGSEVNLLNTSFISSLKEEDWDKDPQSLNRTVHIRNIISNEYNAIPILAHKMTEKLYKLFNNELGISVPMDKIQPFNEIVNIVGGIDPHGDSNADSVKYGAVVYLTSSYTGGQIYYDKMDILHQPLSGQLVIHPGTDDYSHGVKPVSGDGLRFSMPTFIFE